MEQFVTQIGKSCADTTIGRKFRDHTKNIPL